MVRASAASDSAGQTVGGVTVRQTAPAGAHVMYRQGTASARVGLLEMTAAGSPALYTEKAGDLCFALHLSVYV